MLSRAFLVMVLMSSILLHSYAGNQNDEQKTEEPKKPKKEGFLARIIEKVEEKIPLIDKKEEAQKQEVIKKEVKINPAVKFPDPIFYSAMYPHKPLNQSLLWIHNDKSFHENQHIPPILNFNYVIDDLFKMIPYYENTSELLLIIESAKDRNDINFNKQDRFGNTLLHYAIRYHNKPVFLKLLTTKKVNPNVCNYSYICPIHLSIYKDNKEEINQLITYGADLRYSNDRFEMPIITAIRIHHMSSVYTLARSYKQKGISTNEIDYIIYVTKDEGLHSLAQDLYEFFMLNRDLAY